MIASDFSQSVIVGTTELYVTGLVVDENIDGIVPGFRFRVHSAVNPNAENVLALSKLVLIGQNDALQSVSWTGYIESVQVVRTDDDDIYEVGCVGEADRLSRIRFTKQYPASMTASEIVNAVMSDYASGTGIDTAGVENNQQNIGGLMVREETITEVFTKISRRTGWAFSVESGSLKFYDPLTRAAPFQIESGSNMQRSTLRLDQSLAGVYNVVRGEAYEYQNVSFSKGISGCAQTVFGPQYGAEWKVSEPPVIKSPDELEGFTGEVNLTTGAVEFGDPLSLPGSGDPNDQEFTVTIAYQVRRKVLVEYRDDTSISQYGERVGTFNANNGGDDIETVSKRLEADINRKSQPKISGSVRVNRLGIRAGMFVSITPFGQITPQSVIVTKVGHVTDGVDCQVSISFESRSYFFAEPVYELMERIENLERSGLHEDSISGKVIREIGNVKNTGPVSFDVVTVSDNVIATIAFVGKFTGGGNANLTPQEIKFARASLTGSGALNYDYTAIPGERGQFTGGGGINFSYVDTQGTAFRVTGGGSLMYNSTKVSGVRLNQNLIVI